MISPARMMTESLPSPIIGAEAHIHAGLAHRVHARQRLSMRLAFLALRLGIDVTESGTKVALGWFVLNFFLMTCGELCLAPVGMSTVTKLAPRRIVGVMMGAFFLAYSTSSYISDLVAQLTAPKGVATAGTAAVTAYADVYTRLGVMALGLALVLFALAPVLTRRMHEAQPSKAEPPKGSDASQAEVL